MKQGFKAGCSLEVTLKFADFENVKPSFYCGINEEYDSECGDNILTNDELYTKIRKTHAACRAICEEKIDTDIYDVKEVKLYTQINKMKGKK
jgi:hypothetical protein